MAKPTTPILPDPERENMVHLLLCFSVQLKTFGDILRRQEALPPKFRKAIANAVIDVNPLVAFAKAWLKEVDPTAYEELEEAGAVWGTFMNYIKAASGDGQRRLITMAEFFAENADNPAEMEDIIKSCEGLVRKAKARKGVAA